MNAFFRGYFFACGFILFVSVIAYYLYSFWCWADLKVRFIRLEKATKDFLISEGWVVIRDKATEVCISRSGYRITLHDATQYMIDHNNKSDKYNYWETAFMIWNYVPKEDEKE